MRNLFTYGVLAVLLCALCAVVSDNAKVTINGAVFVIGILGYVRWVICEAPASDDQSY